MDIPDMILNLYVSTVEITGVKLILDLCCQQSGMAHRSELRNIYPLAMAAQVEANIGSVHIDMDFTDLSWHHHHQTLACLSPSWWCGCSQYQQPTEQRQLRGSSATEQCI
jgi:hypothetical protein